MADMKLNSAGMDELLKSAGVEALVEGIAQEKAARAKASAPVDSGDYRDSIEVWTEVHPTRVVAHYGSTAPHAAVVEARTGNIARSL